MTLPSTSVGALVCGGRLDLAATVAGAAACEVLLDIRGVTSCQSHQIRMPRDPQHAAAQCQLQAASCELRGAAAAVAVANRQMVWQTQGRAIAVEVVAVVVSASVMVAAAEVSHCLGCCCPSSQ